VPGETDLNDASDIFVYDTVAKTMTNITHGANAGSLHPSISPELNGRVHH
jgi:hypothetical protein